MYLYVDFKIALDLPFLSQYYGGSFSLNIVFPLVGSSFSVVFVGDVLCVYLYIYYTRLWFWACWVSGSFSGGPGHIFFLRGVRCVECRAGTIYLSASLGWVAGLYRFFLPLGSVVVGTVRLKCGRVWTVFFSCFLQFAVCSLGRWLSVVGLPFPYKNIFLFWYYLSVSYFISCKFCFDSLQVVEEGYGPGGL